MVFIAVLVAVSFVSIMVTACLTLITLASRTASWSASRTAALYSAEAGVSRWLFEASAGLPDADDDTRHDYLMELEVAGELNSVPYETRVEEYSDEDYTYRLVSVADSSPRDVAVRVGARLVTVVWHHVLYCREVDELLGFALRLLGLSPCDLSGMDPPSGENGPVLLDWHGHYEDEEDPFPLPEWERYHAAVAPQLDGWTWPQDRDAKNRDLGRVYTPTGNPPFFYEKVTVGTLRGPVNGDLYLKDCQVDRIEGLVKGSIYVEESSIGEIAAQVQGGIYIRDLKQDYEVGRITGSVGGSVCVLCPETPKGGGTLGSYEPVLLGGREPGQALTVGGSVYVRGKVANKQGHRWLPSVVCIAGPNSSRSVVRGGVFAEDASVYVAGNVDVLRNEDTHWPAILARGVTVLNSAGQSLMVGGPVYSQAGDVWELRELLRDAANDAGWPHLLCELFGAALDWLSIFGPNPGFVAIGSLQGAGPNRINVSGNVVTTGMPIITGSLFVDYDESLLDSRNHPPYFVGGKVTVALAAGTWRTELVQDGQGER